jgi:hypothetical protein
VRLSAITSIVQPADTAVNPCLTFPVTLRINLHLANAVANLIYLTNAAVLRGQFERLHLQQGHSMRMVCLLINAMMA